MNFLFSKYRLAEAQAAYKDFESTARHSIFSRRELHLMVEQFEGLLRQIPYGLRKYIERTV